MLLPIMKIVMRNIMSRTVVHLSDEIPEIVLMNVEVFNSLFMSYCMQNSPSIWTTLGLILIDGTQMIASMHDVEKVIRRMQIVKDRVTTERARLLIDNPTVEQILELRRKTILGYAQDILERHNPTQVAQVVVAAPKPEGPIVVPFGTSVVPDNDARTQLKYSATSIRSQFRQSFSLVKVFSMPKHKAKEGMSVTKLELDYAINVRKVLYITEFVLLLNYVEVIVPIIFSANLIAMYHHPNRVYYAQIKSMDDEKLRRTLGNVMLYCFLQVVSLVVLFYVLWHRLRISGLRQLAFVLEKQGEQIQTKLVFWVFYNVQATLQHYGAEASAKVSRLELQYALNVRKVLYITEFVILINYVEVIVPIIFSANLIIMYHLPNHVYYSQIKSMDDEKLRQTLGNVMLYCLLQLVSLVVLFFVLWHRMKISGLRQLAFVLEKQGEQVQTKLVLWVFYNVQATLQHFASDYTFTFAWLHNTT
ncbi:ABCG transporter ABC Superfamily [Phytophthora cinnamomi]|uniref:ABCG transporter ABC Superfamily n=1 Tax=Phytophthora cinnamomi TaxID=4785 RepID=UPI00355A3615|nr:ABCG transporter ABC Superfamily [Phytophthora cinnamomi]